MSGETILIVEDNESLRDGIHEMLTLEGFSVLSACNGSEAIEILRQSIPDLILSDVMMPGIDGFDFYSLVRARPELVTVPFIFLTARSDPADFLKGRDLGADDYLTKPISRDELVTTIRSRLSRMNQVKLAQLQQAYTASLTMMANAIEARGPTSHRHIERVTAAALMLAAKLGWSERAMFHLRFAAILHDIGKLHISDQILFKEELLDEADWEEIRHHPVIGTEMIRGIPLLADTIPIIRHHHEAWNGSGYPDKLAGKDIPPGSRILAVVDSFDVMVSPRRYGKQLALEEALQEVTQLSGQKYDPEVVAALQSCWEEAKLQKIYASED